MEGEVPLVYLVMGSKTACKTLVADTIAGGLGATEVETSKAGVRVFATAAHPTCPVLVDTVPFKSTYFLDVDPSNYARKWISVNSSFRRLFDRKIVLVGVVNSTLPADFNYEGFNSNQFPLPRLGWLPLLTYIFREYKEAKILLVNSDNSPESQCKRCKMKDILVKEGIAADNVVLSNLSRNGLLEPASVMGCDPGRWMTPFLLKAVTSRDSPFGPWGPERVILFGRAGSGKSTVARMLISGKLDDPSGTNPFRISSSIRGGTNKVVRGEGRGWYVVDTPGFGEPMHDLSTIYSDVAQKTLKKYVRMVEGTYSHYLYVMKRNPFDQLDQRLWQFFLLLFGENIRYHFTVVVTDADAEWIDKNRASLETLFVGCQSFVPVEFPFVIVDDEACESDQQETRAKSLVALEDELASHERQEVFCDVGRFSWVTAKREVANITSVTVKSLSKKVSNSFRAMAVIAYAQIMMLLLQLMRDNRIVLLPLIDDDESADLLHDHGRYSFCNLLR